MPFKSYPNPFSGAQNRSKKYKISPKLLKFTYPLRKSLVLLGDYQGALGGALGGAFASLVCKTPGATALQAGVRSMLARWSHRAIERTSD